MLTVKDVSLLDGSVKTLTFPCDETKELDASHLTLLPGLIDPHVHFRVPGQDYKEDWIHAARAAIHGGYTQVFDMPNNIPPCVTKERLQAKKALINQQLIEANVPLRYELYFGADKNNFDQIYQITKDVVGIKVFMGSSTGELLMDDDSSLHAVFAIAGKHNMLVALHAEDECMIQERSELFQGEDHHLHSKIRNPEVAARAIEKVVFLSKMYDVRAYVLHVSTVEELAVIRQAKAQGVKIYAETTPHHLFLNTGDYEKLHGRAQMNPPVRDPHHQEALFQAIADGVIDTVGSDHAPHTKQEKDQVYGKSPSGVPGIETTLPLLLNAYHQGLISLEKIVDLTYNNPMAMFSLEKTDDFVLVDLNLKKPVAEDSLQTKCGWSPFTGRELQGWPVAVYLREQLFVFK